MRYVMDVSPETLGQCYLNVSLLSTTLALHLTTFCVFWTPDMCHAQADRSLATVVRLYSHSEDGCRDDLSYCPALIWSYYVRWHYYEADWSGAQFWRNMCARSTLYRKASAQCWFNVENVEPALRLRLVHWRGDYTVSVTPGLCDLVFCSSSARAFRHVYARVLLIRWVMYAYVKTAVTQHVQQQRMPSTTAIGCCTAYCMYTPVFSNQRDETQWNEVELKILVDIIEDTFWHTFERFRLSFPLVSSSTHSLLIHVRGRLSSTAM